MDSITVPASLSQSLTEFLATVHDRRSPAEAVVDAIQYWLDNVSWKPELLIPRPHCVTRLLAAGDNGFLNECRHVLPPALAQGMTELLGAIRTRHPGELVRGTGRKWVNRPANFVAFTIRPRRGAIEVSVKGPPHRHRSRTFQLRAGWGSYSCFHLMQPDQLIDAGRIILAAAALNPTALYAGTALTEPAMRNQPAR